MLGHDDVAVNAHMVAATDTFKGLEESESGLVGDQKWLPMITGAGDEVGLSGMMVAFE